MKDTEGNPPQAGRARRWTRKPKPDWRDVNFDGEEHVPRKRRKRRKKPAAPSQQLWTADKALLVERYLYGFIMVTKDGTYIDGFAGQLRDPGSWAAKRVLELRPPLLKHFFLYEIDPQKLNELNDLQARHQGKGRTVEVFPEDFNGGVTQILQPDRIPMNEPTFALLDQQTKECRWETVSRLADYKRQTDYKIEQFYFLADSWLDRVLESTVREDSVQQLCDWWGRDTYYEELRPLRGPARAELVAERFRKELGYSNADHYAIYDPEKPSKVMFYMVHATDHPRAPSLMSSAYKTLVKPDPEEPWRQLRLE